MTTTSPSEGALYGITASLRGYTQTAPQIRYAVDGSELLEFKVKLIDDWPPQGPQSNEIVVVRYAGQQRELDRWLQPNKHVLLSGVLHLARWTGKQDGKERAQLLLEATDVQPLGDPQPNPSRAAAYAPRPPQPAQGQPPTQEQRMDRLENLVQAAEDPAKPARPKPTQAETAERSRRYAEIYGR